MGCLGSKDRLTKEDMEFLKTHTRYDEATIKEWYKGFKVSFVFENVIRGMKCPNFHISFLLTINMPIRANLCNYPGSKKVNFSSKPSHQILYLTDLLSIRS